jgi:glycosyltransferase involved in cell wall biosynthesis
MKIGFLSRHYGTVSRGAEVYVHELAKVLGKLGHEVRIYKHVWDHVDQKTHILIGINGRLDNLLARLWSLVHGAKFIIPGQSGLGIDDKFNVWLFPDAFIGLTHFQSQWAKKINPFIRVETIPNGVDLQKFNPRIKPMKLIHKKPIVLFVGAMHPSKPGEIAKRPDLIVKAIKNLDCIALFVGKGGDKQVSHQDMPSVYTACDVFCFPTSPREAFGIVLLEAMACGLPVVTTDDPIRREIVDDAGLFVQHGDAHGLSQALAQALNINWQDKPVNQAKKFSWEKIAYHYDQLFKNL